MSELADMLFADLEIESAAEQVLPTVKVSSASRSEARSTMKKILAGQIDVNSLDIRMESLRHLRPGVSLETVRTITKQLGFTPRNLVDVSCYHPYLGHPQVLELYPLNVKDPTVFDDRDTVQIPFPTTFWISCPILHAEISQHEENGMVLQLTNRLLHESDSQAHLEAMEAAHRAYAEERWALLTPEDREFVVASGWEDCLRNVGVAGIRNFGSIKCLHTHFAHYASRPQHNNVVGRWVYELLCASRASSVTAPES